MNILKNKNILFVVHDYRNFHKNQIEELSKYFNHVYVLVRYKPIAEIARFLPISFLKKHTKKNIINNTNKPNNITVCLTPTYYFPLKGSYKKLGEKHYCSVKKIIKKHNIHFDIIHAHFAWTAGYVGYKLKKEYKIPFILTCHGYDIYRLPFEDLFYRNIIKKIIDNADSNITVSQSNLQCYLKLNVDKKAVKVIGNGFDQKLFFAENKNKCRELLNLPLNNKILLSVGNFEVVKGHIYLIDALKDILINNNDLICIIIGSGSLRSTLIKKIKNNKLQNKIRIVDQKNHEEISLWINACDLFVLPSIKESFGVVQIEAMACGKPIVATRNGGSEYIITSKDIGLLCEKQNTDDLKSKILIAINKQWDRDLIIKNSVQYQWINIVNNIKNVYIDILNKQ